MWNSIVTDGVSERDGTGEDDKLRELGEVRVVVHMFPLHVHLNFFNPDLRDHHAPNPGEPGPL